MCFVDANVNSTVGKPADVLKFLQSEYGTDELKDDVMGDIWPMLKWLKLNVKNTRPRRSEH